MEEGVHRSRSGIPCLGGLGLAIPAVSVVPPSSVPFVPFVLPFAIGLCVPVAFGATSPPVRVCAREVVEVVVVTLLTSEPRRAEGPRWWVPDALLSILFGCSMCGFCGLTVHAVPVLTVFRLPSHFHRRRPAVRDRSRLGPLAMFLFCVMHGLGDVALPFFCSASCSRQASVIRLNVSQ